MTPANQMTAKIKELDELNQAQASASTASEAPQTRGLTFSSVDHNKMSDTKIENHILRRFRAYECAELDTDMKNYGLTPDRIAGFFLGECAYTLISWALVSSKNMDALSFLSSHVKHEIIVNNLRDRDPNQDILTGFVYIQKRKEEDCGGFDDASKDLELQIAKLKWLLEMDFEGTTKFMETVPEEYTSEAIKQRFQTALLQVKKHSPSPTS